MGRSHIWIQKAGPVTAAVHCEEHLVCMNASPKDLDRFQNSPATQRESWDCPKLSY